MSNFTVLPHSLTDISEAAQLAEKQIMADPRAACIHARRSLELIVHWMYRHDKALSRPYDTALGALLHEPTFMKRMPEKIFQKTKAIQRYGNQAAHSDKKIDQRRAYQIARELHHICYWLVRTYVGGNVSLEDAQWDDNQVPRPINPDQVVPRRQLEAAHAELSKKAEAELKQQQEIDARDAEIQKLRQQIAETVAAQAAVPDNHDYSEDDTRRLLTDVALTEAGWSTEDENVCEYEVSGMPNDSGIGYVDYVLWGDDGKPLAVVEAKRALHDAEKGKQQAKLYADCLEQMHDQRPLIFCTNGYAIWFWDDTNYPSRRVGGFYKKDELESLVIRREQRVDLNSQKIAEEIAGRYYQKRAITSIGEHLASGQRRALLVMATGTGKTRTAIALVDVMQRAGWVKRALFLADRRSLVKQAVNAFKTHLPESSPVNLISEKDTSGRVYVSTYPTMMGLIDSRKGGTQRFGVGHFDLVIIDEAHRSVYQKYGEIFEYFDAILVGLTATPSEEIHKDTYKLFNLQKGNPTDAYELELAVNDGFLVPPRVDKVNLRYPREGIEYNNLSEEEQAQWENLDWGDDVDSNAIPARINAAAVNSWLFNEDTVDKALEHVLENGHRVVGGDHLAKTIIFARNHEHAKFIESRFDHHYPQYKGHFARVIDNYEDYADSLIDEFKSGGENPFIAISVDMLDTGIDIPEIANLVFFKPVYSKIKFWQMIGRGTRLCPDLFGPGKDKEDFRIFDFCSNFEFFSLNPEGLQRGGGGTTLNTKLFRARVDLVSNLKATPDLDPDKALGSSVADGLHEVVTAMNKDNFIVRRNLEVVHIFEDRGKWDSLTDEDRTSLHDQVSTLSTTKEQDNVEARSFDLTALRMQLAVIQSDVSVFERHRQRVVDMAEMLQEKDTIPAVREQLAYLASMQEEGFWDGMNVHALEDMRLRLRGLAQFIDRKNKTIVYTAFEDEIQSVHREEIIEFPKMTGMQYEKRVRAYLKQHEDHLVIQRLRNNQPLTGTDLEGLEKALIEIGSDDGEKLLVNLLERTESESLPYFIRSMVGMDRQTAFSKFLDDRNLNSDQIRFVELIIDQLTERGVMDAGALYEAPFNRIHSGGPEALFAGNENIIEGIFGALDTTKPIVIDAQAG